MYKSYAGGKGAGCRREPSAAEGRGQGAGGMLATEKSEGNEDGRT